MVVGGSSAFAVLNVILWSFTALVVFKMTILKTILLLGLSIFRCLTHAKCFLLSLIIRPNYENAQKGPEHDVERYKVKGTPYMHF